MKNLAYRICCYFETVKKSFITLFDIELYVNKLVDGFSNPPFFYFKTAANLENGGNPWWEMQRTWNESLREICNRDNF